jgi:hypothetical protein
MESIRYKSKPDIAGNQHETRTAGMVDFVDGGFNPRQRADNVIKGIFSPKDRE